MFLFNFCECGGQGWKERRDRTSRLLANKKKRAEKEKKKKKEIGESELLYKGGKEMK